LLEDPNQSLVWTADKLYGPWDSQEEEEDVGGDTDTISAHCFHRCLASI